MELWDTDEKIIEEIINIFLLPNILNFLSVFWESLFVWVLVGGEAWCPQWKPRWWDTLSSYPL
jgi:hypothetical protein